MKNNIIITIFASIILVALIISIVNIGLSLFYEAPEWDDFCGGYRARPLEKSVDINEEIVCPAIVRTCDDGTTLAPDPERNCEFPSCSSDFDTCQDEYENARDNYNQIRFYVFAALGFLLLIFGLYSKEFLMQWPSLASGGILIIEGVVVNFENKITVFISLILILVVFGYLARKIINKLK